MVINLLIHLGLKNEQAVSLYALLSKDYYDKTIQYGLDKAEEKIAKFRNDSRLYSVIINEIKKNCYTKAQQREYFDGKKRRS